MEHDRVLATEFLWPGGHTDVAAVRGDYTRAVDLLTEVVLRRWGPRFAQIELPALMDLNRILVRARSYGVQAAKLDPRLVKPLDVDVRVVATSYAGDSQINIEVAEPSGERAGWNREQTAIGGLIGRFVNNGEGLEEYLLHKAVKGRYVVRAVESANGNRLSIPLTMRVDIYTHFGREDEQCRSLTLRLRNTRETIAVGRLKF